MISGTEISTTMVLSTDGATLGMDTKHGFSVTTILHYQLWNSRTSWFKTFSIAW